jgi:hypothetical protein
VTTIATGGSNRLTGPSVGPDGCLYVNTLDKILKVTGGPGCLQANAGPEIELTQTGGSATPATGSSVGFTAQLVNVPAASGTPVHFQIVGPNAQSKLVDANGAGQGTTAFAGIFQGVDTVTAWAMVNGQAVTSAPVQVHWLAGRDTTFLSLSQSQQGGPSGQLTRLVANLSDLTTSPATPIAGAAVTISVGAQSCVATTDAFGNAACTVTPLGGAGLQFLTASYAGDAAHTAATGSSLFELGGVGFASPGATTTSTSPLAPQSTAAPRVSGTPTPGHRLSCSTGSWSGSPTSFSYQWSRDGHPIAGATGASYTVQIGDEARSLACTVTASNAFGSASRTSAPVLVALPGTLRCPKPSGHLKGRTLGRLALGMTRAEARKKLKRFAVTRNNFDDFCLFGGWGIRAGYPSSMLLRTLSAGERSRVKNRIILALTANPYYALDGLRPGARMTSKVIRRLHTGKAFHIGANYWFVAPGRRSVGVFKVRGGVIQEVGIADRRLTGGRQAQLRFLRSFTPARP